METKSSGLFKRGSISENVSNQSQTPRFEFQLCFHLHEHSLTQPLTGEKSPGLWPQYLLFPLVSRVMLLSTWPVGFAGDIRGCWVRFLSPLLLARDVQSSTRTDLCTVGGSLVVGVFCHPHSSRSSFSLTSLSPQPHEDEHGALGHLELSET